MVKYKQTIVSSEDGTIRGNCFRTALGCIMNIDPETIPPFENLEDRWFPIFYDWLRTNGYEFDGTMHKGRIDEGELNEYEGINGYVIVGGTSPRRHVTSGHAVVYYKGKFIHDPHPSDEGILEPTEAYLIRPLNEI